MGHIAKHRVALSPEHSSLVGEAVASGEFSSPEEVVEQALRDWKERRENFGYSIAELRAAVQDGIDSGPARDGQSVIGRLRVKYGASAR